MQDNSSPELTTWGVGPWQGEWPEDAGTPEAPNPDSILDPELLENWQHDLNIGSIVRTANAFLAEEVHIIGNRRWNRRGAMVTDRYQHVSHHPTVEEFVAWTKERNLPIIAIDNVPGCQKIEEYSLPEECVLLFGQEGPGLSEAAIEAAH
ncbi:MAG: hypothetical protein RL600_1043, partial [Actinomycetota bacterium]